MERENVNSYKKVLSCRSVVIRHLPIIPSFINKETTSLCNNSNISGRSRLTACRDDKSYLMGFTLIELLVVVLIIGILAAVALPQYQKAVEKSKATQALTLLKSVGQAAEVYYLANGTDFSSFSELSLDIPFTVSTPVRDASTEGLSNGQWTLEIEPVSALGVINLIMTRLEGKYQGAGFFIALQTTSGHSSDVEIYCFERKNGATHLFDASLKPGEYCVNLMKGNFNQETSATRIYKLS